MTIPFDFFEGKFLGKMIPTETPAKSWTFARLDHHYCKWIGDLFEDGCLLKKVFLRMLDIFLGFTLLASRGDTLSLLFLTQ